MLGGLRATALRLVGEISQVIHLCSRGFGACGIILPLFDPGFAVLNDCVAILKLFSRCFWVGLDIPVLPLFKRFRVRKIIENSDHVFVGLI